MLEMHDSLKDFQAVQARNPFVLRIQQAVTPPEFVMPYVPLYGEELDPHVHLQIFNLHMDTFLASDDLRCKAFATTFEKITS